MCDIQVYYCVCECVYECARASARERERVRERERERERKREREHETCFCLRHVAQNSRPQRLLQHKLKIDRPKSLHLVLLVCQGVYKVIFLLEVFGVLIQYCLHKLCSNTAIVEASFLDLILGKFGNLDYFCVFCTYNVILFSPPEIENILKPKII